MFKALHKDNTLNLAPPLVIPMPNLDGLTMYVSSTASNGVVDAATRLYFRQSGDRVMARYAGGDVVRGLLIGRSAANRLVFRYAQRERDGTIQAGRSECEVLEFAGRTRIMERFTWSTRTGSGENVFDEVPDSSASQFTESTQARP